MNDKKQWQGWITIFLKTCAPVLLLWLLLPTLSPIRSIPFQATAWQEFRQRHFVGGQLFAVAPSGDLTRLQMTEDLIRNHLRLGMSYREVQQLLGEGESSGDGVHYNEDSYGLADRPGMVMEVLLLRRWGNNDPVLHVEGQDGVLTRFYVR